MTIKGLVFKDFRGYNELMLELHPKYNLLRGANGSGKTTLLQGISWGLTGVCNMTSADGNKDWRDLVRDDEKQMTVGVNFVDIGYVERTRSLKRKHELILPQEFGMSDTAAAGATKVLLNRLGVPEDTLMYMLDTTPFVERDPEKQRAAMSRILQGKRIEVPPEARAAGIDLDEFRGSSHLDDTIKSLKNVDLRDAKRAVDNLQKQQIERPEWPAEGRTKEQIEEGRQQVVDAISDLEKAIGKHEARIEGLELRKSQGVPTFEVLPEEEVAALEKQTAAAAEQVNTTEGQVEAKEKEVQDATTTISNQAALAHEYAQQLSKLPTEVDCPADACPLRQQYAAEHGERRAELEAKAKKVSERGAELSKKRQAAQDELDTLRDEQEKAVATWKELTNRKATHDREAKRKAEFGEILTPEQIDKEVSGIRTLLDDDTAELEKHRNLLQMADDKIAAVRDYENAKEKADTHASDLTEKAAEVAKYTAAIEALERVRSEIVGGKIEEFLGHVNDFLSTLDVPEVGYSFDVGFTVGGAPLARYLSAGQTEMFFEAALRVGCAKLTRWNIVLLDGSAQVDDRHFESLVRALTKCGCQVIHVHTTEKSEAPASPNYKVLLAREGEAGREVVELGAAA